MPLFHLLLLLGFSSCLAAAESDALRMEYLELRDINYRFVQKYKEYLMLKESGDVRGSLRAEREFRKQWKNYLLKMPSQNAYDDPNGYYSSPERFGFNPLLWKPINNLYKAQPVLQGQGQPKIFTDPQGLEPVAMNVDSPGSGSGSGHEFEGLPTIDENELESILTPNDPGLPLQGDPTGTPNSFAPISSQPSGSGPKSKTPFQSGSGTPPNPEQRVDNAVERYGRGVKLMGLGTQRVDRLLAHYEKLLADPNPNPHKLIALNGHLSRSLGRLHHLNGVLKRVNNRIEFGSDKLGIEPDGLDMAEVEQKETRRKLIKITERFEQLEDESGNLFTLLPPDMLDEMFDGAQETLGPPPLNPGNPNPQVPGQNPGTPNTGTGVVPGTNIPLPIPNPNTPQLPGQNPFPFPNPNTPQPPGQNPPPGRTAPPSSGQNPPPGRTAPPSGQNPPPGRTAPPSRQNPVPSTGGQSGRLPGLPGTVDPSQLEEYPQGQNIPERQNPPSP